MSSALPLTATGGFEHDVFFYGDLDAYARRVGAFVREGLDAGEAVLVATVPSHAEALSDHLDDRPGRGTVTFVDVEQQGRNPGRLLQLWHSLVGEALDAGRGARGVGEPVWSGRSADEILECQHNEVLVNLAFDSGPAWSLLCPYDVSALSEAVLQEAMRSHPSVVVNDARLASSRYLEPDRVTGLLADPLPEPAAAVTRVPFDGDALSSVRERMVESARAGAVADERVADLALVVHELATNSVQHGGGRGVARWWGDDDRFVVEVSDAGHLDDPLAGRTRPPLEAEGGRGLWLVHQLSDLVELRTSPSGTVVRVQMKTR